jgi:type II secretory pathway pseudopilin PulG
MACIVFVVCTSIVVVERCSGQEAKANGRELLKLLPSDAIAAMVASPKSMAAKPEMEMMPREIVTAAGLKELGFDPMEIESLIGFIQLPQDGMPPGFGLMLKSASAFDQAAAMPQLAQGTVPGMIAGRKFMQAPQPFMPSLLYLDSKTLIIAPEATLVQMLEANGKEGALQKRLAAIPANYDLSAVLLFDSLRPLVKAELDNVPLPPVFSAFKALPDHIAAIELQVTMTGGVRLMAQAPNAESGAELERLLGQAMEIVKGMITQQAAQLAASEDPVEQATAKYSQRMMTTMLKMLEPKRDGDRLTISMSNESGALMGPATMGVGVALLLPAVQAAREAARRSQSMNNLKIIGLAMHNYADAMQHLPARANVDKNGKPLLSWRVHLLPYLEEAALYQQFHLDEPWDSEHNKKLIAKMPAIYRQPNGNAEDFKTCYLVPVAKGTMFESFKPVRFAQITDGTSNTIMAMEASLDSSVIWTKPEDIEIDMKAPLDGLLGLRPGGFQALFADGSVRFISQTIDLEALRGLFTMSGGEVIQLP